MELSVNQPRRPGMLTFLAVMQFASAAASLAIGLGMVVALSYGTGTSSSGVLLAPGMFVFRGLVQLTCAAGLWTIRPFGRWLALALGRIAVLTGVAQLAIGPPPMLPVAGLGIPMTPLVATLSGIWLRSVPNPLSIVTLV